MNHPFLASLGYLADTASSKGLGVFASHDIETGELVEVAPVIQLPSDFKKLPDKLQQRVFNWSGLAGLSGVHALALGYGSMYNHANPANLRYYACNAGSAIAFAAACAIRAGEELTINYNAAGGDVASSEDNWFARNGITPSAK